MGRAVSVVAGGILLSRVAGFARNVVLASRLGDTPMADAYEAAFVVPDFLNYLLAGGFPGYYVHPDTEPLRRCR